jgi:hypothetical protein
VNVCLGAIASANEAQGTLTRLKPFNYVGVGEACTVLQVNHTAGTGNLHLHPSSLTWPWSLREEGIESVREAANCLG